MPNENIYVGSDASLVLSVEQDDSSDEGSLASDLISEYDLSTVVGRLHNVQVRVEQVLRHYHELGNRYATDLRPGTIRVSGTSDRAHINGALLSLLLGDGSKSPAPKGTFAQPSFNMVINLNSPAQSKITNKLVVFGVKFESWNFHAPEDDFVMESVSFKALRVSVEEEEGDGGGE